MKEIKYRLSEDWSKTNKVVLFGCGGRANEAIEFTKKYYDIIYYLDSDKEKSGKKFNELDILWIKDVKKKNKLKEYKIIITTFGLIASEMAEQLTEYGLVEYKDFCKFEEWLLEFEWKRNKKIYLSHQVDISINSKCTLNCKHCSLFMPYFKKVTSYNYNLADFQYNINLLFSHIDYVSRLCILGGEPLLNKDLVKMIEWIGITHKDKIGKILINSNGTILPNKELLKICSQYKDKIFFVLSNYTEQVNYKARFEEISKLIKDANIDCYIFDEMKWSDLGFPAYKFLVQKGKEKEHMLACTNNCHGLIDGKLYYCITSLTADKSGLFKARESDYVDLKNLSKEKEIDKIKIMQLVKGEISSETGAISLCTICGGTGLDNNRIVKAGVQM